MVSHEDWRIHFARYQQMMKRRRLLGQIRIHLSLIALVALVSWSVIWAWSYKGAVSFSSKPEVRVWRGSSPVSYRTCAAARAAGAAPLYRGQPGYASHLDADGDGIACEPYPRW